MKALEKRKFTVALALLRKPFKENLFLAAWACADEEGFHRALADGPDQHMAGRRLQPGKRKDIFAAAIAKLDVPSALTLNCSMAFSMTRSLRPA